MCPAHISPGGCPGNILVPFVRDFAAGWWFFGVLFCMLCLARGLSKYQDRHPTQYAQRQNEHSGV